jgi:serine/threonine-protein kinase
MAPEVALGASASRASDIYSLGVVIFEMLARRRPFDVREKDELLAALEDGAPDLMSFRPDLPPGVRVVVNQALSHAPESRPARASALALALSRAAGLDRAPCPPKRQQPPPPPRPPVVEAVPEAGAGSQAGAPPPLPKAEPHTPPPEVDPHTPSEVLPPSQSAEEQPGPPPAASPIPELVLPRLILPPDVEPPTPGPPTRPSLITAADTPDSLEGATPAHLDAVKESRQPARWLYVLSVLALLVVILIVVVVLISLWTSPSSDFLGLPPLLR